MCLTCPIYRHANHKLSLCPFSSPGAGEGMAAALSWRSPPLPLCPMPNSVTDLTLEILQTEVAMRSNLDRGVEIIRLYMYVRRVVRGAFTDLRARARVLCASRALRQTHVVAQQTDAAAPGVACMPRCRDVYCACRRSQNLRSSQATRAHREGASRLKCEEA